MRANGASSCTRQGLGVVCGAVKTMLAGGGLGRGRRW